MESFEREQLFNMSGQMADLANRLAVIESNYATKADVLEAKNSLIMWIIGLGVVTQAAPFALRLFG